jgi:hypothetical protein
MELEDNKHKKTAAGKLRLDVKMMDYLLAFAVAPNR